MRVVWALAWPAVALNSLQVVNTLLDRLWIGHLPTSALTAHGGSTNVMFLMFSLAVAIATGATALVSRAFGAGDQPQYRRAAQESLSLAVGFGLVLAALTLLIAAPASEFILPSADIDARRTMFSFLRAYAVGLPAICVIQTLAGSLRGIGDTKSPMVISGIQIGLHILMNWLLIPSMGLTGAATALSASAWIAAIAYVVYVGRTPVGVLRPWQIADWHWAVRILRIAIPAATMATLRVLSLTAFTLVLKQVSDASAAIAAMSLAFAIESIMFMPAFGLSVAAGALVGQSLGMERPDRAKRLGWVAGHHAALVTIALVSPIFLFAPQLTTALVGNKPEVIREASILIRYLCTTEFLFGYAMVMIGSMQGAGDTTRPMWISIASLWGLRVPLAVILSLPSGFMLAGSIPLPLGVGLGATGAWISMSLTQGIQGVLSIIAFHQGKWAHKKV